MANGLFKSVAGAGALSSAQAANSGTIKTGSLFASQQKQLEENRKMLAEYNQAQERPKDNGGFFGGIGYAFEKLGLGFLQSIEGIWDFTAGGLADLFGAHDWAEQQMANDWVNYGHADEWFNPSDGWKVAGDVAGGIGTSIPALASIAVGAAITYFSGGAASPVAVQLITGATAGLIAGLGAAGTATKEAYNETGQLTGKEWGYGALSGFTEGAMEGVTDAIGFGAGTIVKNFTASAAKEGAKQVGKQVAGAVARQTLGKTMLKGFIGEAFEEGVQEMLDPVWKRLTYDPNAENASFQQVAYAALVGGLSGAIMSGVDVSVRNGYNFIKGSNINNQGGTNGVISLSETIAQTEGVNHSGNEQVDFVVNTLNELQESLKSTGGEVKTPKQKMLVGMLSKANTAAPLSIVVHQNADAIIADAETTVKRLNDIGYKTSKGEAITVEMLTEGVTGERGTKEYRKSISQAMRNNEALRSVAVMSAAGQLNMDAARFQQSTLRGEKLFNQSDLNHFVETATEAQKRDVGERLGIKDWDTVTADELKSRIVEFSNNGGVEQYINEREQIKKLSELEISKKGLPKYVGSIKQDGAVRYKFGDASVAIVKNGDTYLVYDYANDIASKPLTKTEANRVIKEIYAASVQSATDSNIQTKAQQETQQLDTFARENIPDYKKLVGAQQQAVRQTLRQARAAGVSEADQILYASVAARSGINIEFVSAEELGEKNADAGYRLRDGKILVNREIANNPKARTAAKILLHEFTHAMIYDNLYVAKRKSDDGKSVEWRIESRALNEFLAIADTGLTAEQKFEIYAPYLERNEINVQDYLDGKVKLTKKVRTELAEELAAHFVERELGNSAALQRIITDKPSFKDKLLSFLKRSKTEYNSNEKLSRAANALLKKYQAFFNKYATQTRFSQTVESDLTAYKSANTEKQTIKYASMNSKTFKENVASILLMSDEVALKNKTDGNFISVMSETPSVITDNVAGAENLEIIIRFDALYLAARKAGVLDGHYHGLGASVLTNLPSLISNPDAIIRLPNGRLNLLTQIKTEKGNNGIISIELNAVKDINSKYDKYNLVVSVFSAKDNYTRNVINQEGVSIVYKKEDLSQVNPQLYEWLAIINDKSSTDSISQKKKKVNPNSKKSDTKRYALSETGSQNDLDLLFDDEFYKQFENEDKTPISESLEFLEAERKKPDFESRPFEETYDIVTKIKALKAGYKSLYDYYVGTRKDLIIKDYQWGIENGRETTATRTIQEKKAKLEKQKKLSADIATATPHQNAQFEIIQRTNPMFNDTSVGIRSPKEIKTFAEVINDGESFEWGDFSKEDAKKALKRGSVRVFSSYPIKNGVFVSTSYIQALQYAGNDPSGVHSRVVALDSVAWITGDEGQYAKVYKTSTSDNGKNTKNTRFALSEKDTQGRTLTEQQRSFFQNSAIRAKKINGTLTISPDGALMPVYHGTSSDTFYEFDSRTIGSANDMGWYGRGFYFAFSKGEAAMYGSRVMECYLDVENPFFYSEEMRSFDGVDSGDVQFDFASFVINLSDKFSSISKDLTTTIVDSYDSEGNPKSREIGFDELAAELKEIYNSDRLVIQEIQDRDKVYYQYKFNSNIDNLKIDSEIKRIIKEKYISSANWAEYLYKNGQITESQYDKILDLFEQYGETEFKTESVGFRFDTKEYAEKSRLSAAMSYLSDKRYAWIETHIPEYYMEQVGEAFNAELKKRGHDGVVQSRVGDEIVVFDSNQIKLTNNESPSKSKDIRYALPERDSAGTKLSEQQRRFFNDSKIVDKQGRLLPVFHGTPRGGFTVFETEYDGAYFTADKKYATEYTRNGEYGNSPQVYEVYLNIKKPFDTRNPIDRKLFYDEFYMKWGNGTDLQAKGLPDWTDGTDLVEFLKTRGYDGMLIDEGGVPDGNGGVRDRGISYVAFSPEQIKQTTNLAPTSDSDIRYALNTKTASDGRKLTAKQRQFFNNTVAVDSDGKLRVEYHGTDAQFYTFRNQGQNSRQMYGVGFYFTPYEDEAMGYGKRIVKAFLNIQQPIIYGEKHITETQWAQYLDYCKEHANEYVEGVWKGNNITSFDYRDVIDVKNDSVLVTEFVNHISGGSGDVAVAYLRMLRDSLGYDGIQRGEYLIAFTPEQIKKITNTDPTSSVDMRYALSNPDANPEIDPTESDNSGAIGGLTRGQRAKFVANNTKFKVYSKLEAASVVDSIIAERLTLRDGQYEGVLSGKNRAEVIEKLFTKLNSTPEGYRIGVALDIADYIINNAVLTDMYETYNDDSYAMGVLSIMRHYMHGMDLSGIQSEIQYKFDKKNSINLVWGAKQDGIAPDVVAQELEGYGIHIEAINEAEQFFEMLELYESAKEQVNKRVEKIMLTAIGSQSEIEQLRQQIARDVLMAYDKKGTKSKYAKLVEQYTNKIANLKKDLSTAYKRNTLTNRIIDGAAYLRDIATKRNYVGAEIFAAPELTSWLKQLAKIKYRSDLRKSGVRKILLDYGLFYNTNNALLYDENPDLSYIDNNVIDALNFIRQNALSTKPLSMEELQAAEIIIASAKHLFNNYDQVIIEGKKAKITDLATEGNEIIKKTKNRTSKGFFNQIYGVFNKIIEPRVVIKSLENFNPNGILTRAYNEVTRGETEAGLLYIELTNDIDTYIKQHRRFKNRLSSQYVTVAGAELTVGQAISLYELSKRPQAQEGLYESGFSYIDKKGSKQTAHITEADITAMYDAFTDTDKGFIELVETFFNVASKQVKTDADMQILGYTNTSEEFYYPIKRDSGTIAKNITDARSIMSDWANVYNFSFNKDVKTGAKNKLFVTDVYSVLTRHAKQLSTYARMTVPLKNFSQIYAKNIGDKTNVVSIRNTINEQVWGGAEGYLSKLFSDIQGRATSSSIIEKMRGAYAKYQLGANLKVIVSQITSYPTAGIMLDTGVMAKGFVMKTNWAAMDKYCPYARVRNYERGIVKAEGVIDKIGKVGDVLTKPIQWTDRFTIGRLWNACQLQVQKDTGLKFGSVENMQKAGVMLEEVIRLTQPNYTNTERSELMRSDSDLVRSFTMFTSVPLKQLSRLVESFGEFNALRSLIKSGDTDATLARRYKLAKKKLRRTLASVTVANLMYVLVGQFFKFLYNNMAEDDEEGKVTAKSVFLDMLKDFGSTTIGMLPVVRDVYSYFADGYEINSFTADMLNSVISSAKSLFELAQKAASGEEISTQDYMSIFRNSIYAIGQITGIPFRNINNTITGLVKRFSPSAAYSYTSLFYNHKYSTDIKDALKKGDYELAETIMGMMLKDDRTGGLSSKATRKLIELYDAGFTVLPKSIGDTLTYEGETIQLTAAQRKEFKTVYSQANAEIEKLVNSAEFASLPAEQQAKAIKLLYDAYYSKAQATVLKVSTDNKIIMLNSAISASVLATHLAAISTIESDTDKKGNVINGSKKAKIIKYVMAQKLSMAQKLLLILALGYTIKDGDIRGVSAAKAKSTVARYITNLKLSKEEKTALAEKCGLTVKNGRIYAR